MMMVLTAPVRFTCLRYRTLDSELTYGLLLHPLYTLRWPRLHHHSHAPLRTTRPPHCNLRPRDPTLPQRPHVTMLHRTSSFRNLPTG